MQSSFPGTGTSTTQEICDEQTARETVNSLLAEGFSLAGELNLDDPQSMSLSLLDDDGLWMTAHADDFDDKVDLSPSCIVDAFCRQGRLHHINDGASAPWKSRGNVFAGT